MRARVRNFGIILTIIFVGLVFYAGFMLFQLPEKIVTSISNETRNQVENSLRILNDTDTAMTWKVKTLRVQEELLRPSKKNTEKIHLAEQETYKAIRAVGLMLLSGLSLMILIFAASFKTSSETIVYIDKKEDDFDGRQDYDRAQHGLLDDIDAIINEQIQEDKEWGKEEFEAFVRLVCTSLKAGAGMLYQTQETDKKREVEFLVGYAVVMPDSGKLSFEYGEGLAGQVAKTQLPLRVAELPNGYMKVFSGLGEATPPYLVVVPILKDGVTKGVFEIATFQPINDHDFQYLENFCSKLSNKYK